ncbi:hypothetical protein [Saccharicrinis aurantiacus]|uniref:hypothetical protein n=1 Tax=Saccharicrinis aurantiacus TaxID=1849719 RepID=UPI002492E551|nr:hypothetical protein [Saccharicrinis aurantiacus]
MSETSETTTTNWEAVIAKMKKADFTRPAIGIKSFIADTELMLISVENDKTELLNAKLDWTIVIEARELTEELRLAQSEWTANSKQKSDMEQEWKTLLPKAENMREELLHHFTFAFRNDSALLSTVRAIREGDSKADLIQDLYDLDVVGNDNIAQLDNTGFNTELLDENKALSRKLKDTHEMAFGAADDNSELKFKRDAILTLLIERDKTIREYGRYVFWRNKDKREKYIRA